MAPFYHTILAGVYQISEIICGIQGTRNPRIFKLEPTIRYLQSEMYDQQYSNLFILPTFDELNQTVDA